MEHVINRIGPFMRGEPKRDCAMFRDKPHESCAGLNNLECCWDKCPFYKPKCVLDYNKSLNDIKEYKRVR